MLGKWKRRAEEELRDEWIRGVVRGLEELSDGTARKVLKACGESCAKSWVNTYSCNPEFYDVDSWIKLVNEMEPGVRNVEREDNIIVYELKPGKCVCPLVTGGIIKPSRKLCLACASNFFEYLFGKVAKKPVKAELVESYATGADKCVFKVHL